MPDGFGVSFAPTAENAMDGARQGSLEGLPAAIKILSLRMPRFLGARGIAPDALLNGQGGEDPFASSVMQTIWQTLAGSRPASPVITPGAGDNTGGTLVKVEEPPPPKVETGTEMGGPEQRRRSPRTWKTPGGIMQGNTQ